MSGGVSAGTFERPKALSVSFVSDGSTTGSFELSVACLNFEESDLASESTSDEEACVITGNVIPNDKTAIKESKALRLFDISKNDGQSTSTNSGCADIVTFLSPTIAAAPKVPSCC